MVATSNRVCWHCTMPDSFWLAYIAGSGTLNGWRADYIYRFNENAIWYLRASLRVCEILFGKSYVLPTSKNICQVKKSSSTLWHNSLGKSKYNLYQESWDKQNFVYVLPPLENLHQESFSILYFLFHPPTYRETPMATTIRARIDTHGEVSFASFYFCQIGLLNCWRPIFLVLPKLDDVKLVCQTVWVALNNRTHFSNYSERTSRRSRSGFTKLWTGRSVFWTGKNGPVLPVIPTGLLIRGFYQVRLASGIPTG
jgi:hypothetical protein